MNDTCFLSLSFSSSSDEAADTIMSALVADVVSRPGALSLLERKLVMLSNQNNELPADGKWHASYASHD